MVFAALYGGGFVFGMYMVFVYKGQRPRPRGYVGRFRKPDGEVVHVCRLPSGDFYVLKDSNKPPWASERNPVDLGLVSGREIVTWEKLADTPDG